MAPRAFLLRMYTDRRHSAWLFRQGKPHATHLRPTHLKEKCSRRRLFAGAVLVPLAVCAAQPLPWQVHPQPDAAAQPVQYEYPEQVELTRGKPMEVDLHFRVRDGLHINSHTPSDKSLIRTELIVAEPPGIDVEAVTFPPGADFALKAFPGQKLSVYTGEVVLHARLLATKPGSQMLNAALRYQACDADTCFPPRKAPVALDIVVR